MPRLTKKALLKHLDKSDKDDIIHEVVILFDKFKNVKEFYQSELSDEVTPALDKYKKKIKEAYAKANPKERTTNANINKLLKEFKKICIYDRELADLMLYRVECGIAAIRKNNKRSPTFYNCLFNTFEGALKLIITDNNLEDFKARLDKVVRDSKPGRYNMDERMADIYNQYLK